VPPARILPGHANDQIPDLVADWCTAGPVRIGPMRADQAPVPRQQCGGGDEAMLPHPPWQQAGQRGQHRPIRPPQIGFADLTTQDRDLMTKNGQLRGLGRVASREPRELSKDLDHGQVRHPNHHDMIVPRYGESPAHGNVRQVLARTGPGWTAARIRAGDRG